LFKCRFTSQGVFQGDIPSDWQGINLNKSIHILIYKRLIDYYCLFFVFVF
jgi:hypothetical protein